MVLDNLFCGLCEEREDRQAASLGRCHGYQQGGLLTIHFRAAHPQELQELLAKAKELRELKKKHHGYNLIGLHH